MSPGEVVARALYERRGLNSRCSPECVDHFEHDSSPEAAACKGDAIAAHAALTAAGYSLMRPISDGEAGWNW